jgi:hypothetical protein
MTMPLSLKFLINKRRRAIVDVGYFYCTYIPLHFIAANTVNRDADPPLDPDDWEIVHGEDFPIDLEWDSSEPADPTKTAEERFIEAYNRAKRAIERM